MRHAHEITILSSMKYSEYIVSFLALDIDNNILLEDGGAQDLRALWESPIKITTQYQIAQDVFRGLAFLSQSRIVHCDLKLDNIVYNGHRAKITDFGSAYALTKEEELNPPIKHWHGTFEYRSPEDCSTKERITEVKIVKSRDLWACGIVLYALYTHKYLLRLKAQLSDKSYPDVAYAELYANFTSNPKTIPNRINRIDSINLSSCTEEVQHQANVIKELVRHCLQLLPEHRIPVETLIAEYFDSESKESDDS